jgi:hypothetical protein
MMMASPAAAQWGSYGPGRFVYDAGSLYGIEATLRGHGMRPVTRPVHSWPYIVVRATDPSGHLVRVLLNARYGNIVEVIPLPSAPVLAERSYPPPGAYPYPSAERRGGVRPDLKAEPDPVGPGVVYGSPPPYGDPQAHGAPGPHDSRASVTPSRTPMPRPRPAQPTATAKVEAPASTGSIATPPAAPQTESAPAAPAAAPAPAPALETAKPSFPPPAPLE